MLLFCVCLIQGIFLAIAVIYMQRVMYDVAQHNNKQYRSIPDSGVDHRMIITSPSQCFAQNCGFEHTID